MLSQPSSPNLSDLSSAKSGSVGLSEFESSMVSLGVTAAAAFSLPKSVGAIYGLAYASAEPITMEDCVERLGIALGSASQGLRFLQRIGALKPVFRPNERRNLYVPEESLRRLVLGILNENILPQLRVTAEQLPDLRAHLDTVADSQQRTVLDKRLENLENWAAKSGKFLPWISKLLSNPLTRA